MSDWKVDPKEVDREITRDEPIADDEMENLEDLIREEMAAIIGDFANDEAGSTIRDLQPPESIIQAMATAAASVLIAFERGYRMGS